MRQKVDENSETQRLARISDLSAIRVRIAAQRLRDHLRFEMRYNPKVENELRLPHGQTGGGQWTGGGGTILVAAAGEGYPVNLLDEEARGAHVIAKHVGVSNDSLKATLRQAQLDTISLGDSAAGLQGQGSFTSLEAATKLVNSTISQNRAAVDTVARGEQGGAQFRASFASPTGYEAYADTERSTPYIRNTYRVFVVIRRDAGVAKGYSVVTAYPTN